MDNKYNRAVSGGVVLRVIVCMVSLMILGGTIFIVLKTFDASKTEDHRKAQRLSEEGLLAAFMKLAESRDWNTGFTDEPSEDGGSFTVEFSREERDGVTYVKVVSTGKSGSITATQTKEIQLPSEEADDDSDPDAPNDGDSDAINDEQTGAEE